MFTAQVETRKSFTCSNGAEAFPLDLWWHYGVYVVNLFVRQASLMTSFRFLALLALMDS